MTFSTNVASNMTFEHKTTTTTVDYLTGSMPPEIRDLRVHKYRKTLRVLSEPRVPNSSDIFFDVFTIKYIIIHDHYYENEEESVRVCERIAVASFFF